MSTVRVLIADSSEIVLEGLISILNASRTTRVVATARSSDNVLKLMAEERPDVSLLSTPLPSIALTDLLKMALDRNREERIILMLDQADIHYVNRLLKAGAIGCITKNVEKKKLRQIVQKAAAGERVFNKDISSLITDSYADLFTARASGGERRHLTDREREILELIVEGYTSQEIADALFISPRTVETHRSNLLHKLKIRNTAGLVRYALEELKSRTEE